MSTTTRPKKTIENLMIELGLLDAAQLEKAKNIQAQTLERLEDILLRMGFLSENQVLEVWAQFLDIDVIDLTNIKIDAKLISIIPEYQAKQYKVIPLKKDGNKLTIVMADPFDIMATDMIGFLTQCKLELMIAPRAQIEDAIKQFYSWDGFSVSGEETITGEDGEDAVRRTSEEGPVVQFLNAVFKQAIQKRASDIHVEPREDILLIRFRIDGLLHDMMTGPKSLLLPLISRVKILAHLDIAEKRLPQDGRLKVRMEGHDIDFRVSTVPSLLGEKAVLRLLARDSAYNLDDLGFLPDDLERVKTQLDEPYGMALVTGPTGAGKTTTLFGMLRYFTNSQINIFTIENPIEYRIDGITQVQTNEKIGLDFAMGLRAALRQDPDVVLVGEVRDLETAEIAFRASLTGHKVLSTLHTNNAPATINRLINMGVPPYLVAAAVKLVIAQKLLHRICPHCRAEYRPSQKTIQRLKLAPSRVAATTFYHGVGCKECNQTGAYGRLGVYESMAISDQLRDIIMEGGTEQVVRRVARLNGMKTMREIAIQRAFEGMTTLEEVLVVTSSDEDSTSSGLAATRRAVPQVIPSVVVASNFAAPAAPGGVPVMGPMGPVALPGAPTAMVATAPAPSLASVQGIDPDDPVFKSVLAKLSDEFLFFTDDQLAEKFQINPVQVRECLTLLGLERNREAFLQRFGRPPESMSDDEAAELVRTVEEKRGRVPSLVFAHDGSAKLFARVMTEAALRHLSERVQDLDLLPLDFTDAFCRENGLEDALAWAGGNRHQLVDLAMPGRYKPWQFDTAGTWFTTGDLVAKTREAVQWFMERQGISPEELPGRMTTENLHAAGLQHLLVQYNKSPFAIAEAVFPGQYHAWEFPEDEERLWFREDRHEIAGSATRWLIETKLAIPVEEVPRRIGLRDFHQHGLSKLLDLFNQNLHNVLTNAYPNRFQPWEYAEQSDIWRGAEALQTAAGATDWLVHDRLGWEPEKAVGQLTRRHFVNNGLGTMLGALFNHSPFLAMENTWEPLKTYEPFQKVLLQFSQDWRDIATRWTSLAEKIAVNLYGKVRFKVALPNLKIAPIVPETERIYYNNANQIEYVPQIIAGKMSAYDDFAEILQWVPFCDQVVFWVLADDRASGYVPPSHPKVRLIFGDALASSLRSKNMVDLAEKLAQLKSQLDRLMDRKAPAPEKSA